MAPSLVSIGRRLLDRLGVWTTRRGYARAGTVASYLRDERLHGCETRAFVDYAAEINEGVIDLGCGAGRTTVALLPITRDYLGVDYVPEMVEVCQERFAGDANARFLVGDAALLESVEDASASFVLFSYNGIDNVGHEHRQRILKEAHRVLRAGGLFAFSHHNLRADGIVRRPPLPRSLAPRALRAYLGELRNSLGKRWFESRGDDWEVINDCADGFSLLVYYCTIESQRRRLREAGFNLVACTDMAGDPVDEANTSAPFVFHVARKN